MQFFVRNPKDFWSGVIFVCIGSTSLFISDDYERGTAGMMGPGYFPVVLGVLLAVIGLVAVIRSIVLHGEGISRLAVGKAVLIVAATVSFGLLVRSAGLAIAIIAPMMIAGYASARFNVRRYLMLALCMAGFSALVFVQALGLPIPVFGAWLGQ
ncbi:tripartite tricarboxylate transporter TctB family protein [Herbaspirillum sp. GCM10030257]|uniref:tripartite tricarboxylate transporter TctB family protein n=1 Tax=Herbaspirillum sp. GCM10030257 TaxID=3273393 RepID=UPI00360A1EF4